MSTDIRAAQKAVKDFMWAGGQKIGIAPGIPPREINKRRVEMLREEVNELVAALDQGDIVEAADAYADIIYVALGGAVEAGVDIEPVLENVIESNNSKIDWSRARPWATHDNGKVAKDHHYVAPNIAPIIEAQENAAEFLR